MAGWGSARTVVAVVVLGVGSFLYNDGRDHKTIGMIATAVGGAATVLNGAAALQLVADEELGCMMDGRPSYCTVEDLGAGSYLWQRFGSPIASEVIWSMIACAVGYGLAMLTRRRPTDGRHQMLRPPDD